MTRVAAIDCGTNSLRLLIADIADGHLRDVVRTMQIVRLGEGVDRTGRFADAALTRTFATLDDYAAQIARHGAHHVRMVATSATRDAANREVFLEGVHRRLGVEAEVVTGEQEAALTFSGATAELASLTEAFPPPYAVCDIGGGSTEIVLGDEYGIRASASVDIGCVRMTERHLHDDPPTVPQVEAATADIDAALRSLAERVHYGEAATLVGLAGSVTTVAAMVLGLPAYDPVAIHHARIGADAVSRTAWRLLGSTRAQRAEVPVMHPGRVDVIAAGALVLERVMTLGRFKEVVVSEHDILDGIALSVVDESASP